jgi:hypothetical protein
MRVIVAYIEGYAQNPDRFSCGIRTAASVKARFFEIKRVTQALLPKYKEKNMAKKIALALIVALAAAGAASAQVTISAGAALSSADAAGVGLQSEAGLGGNIYLDYLLPISVPLSLGFEVGYDTAAWTSDAITAITVPLLLRAAYHFDLNPKLDLYLVGKIGYVIGAVSGSGISSAQSNGITVEGRGGIGFGFDIGVAFYFSPVVGLFAEAGFDRYNVGYTVSGDYKTYEGYGQSSTVNYSESFDVAFNRFLTVGLSFKF